MLKTITICNLLQHLGGFGSYTETGFDPSGGDWVVADALGVNVPVTKLDMQRYMNGQNLYFTPGTNYTYSN